MNGIRFKYSYLDGFRGTKHIDDDFGLLFKHSGEMIMNGCYVPLTAMYLDKDMRIVGTQEMIPEPEPPYEFKKYSLKNNKYNYVLEVKSGIMDKLGWSIGDKLEVKDNTIIKVKSIPLSSISIPKEDLDSSIWEKSGDEHILKESVSKQIVDTLYKKLDEYGYKNYDKWIKGIYLIGSETGNLYDEDSDIDVQVYVDENLYEEFHA